MDPAEVVITEIIANSLDAGATQISVDYDPKVKKLVIADNGKGMGANQFDEYHDFAAGLKTRGTGIGFAGVGAKVSFNVAAKVVTHTKSVNFSGGSNWYLNLDNDLVWEDVETDILNNNGTRVEITFNSEAEIPYSSTEDLTRLLKVHFLPLFDSTFLDLYGYLKAYSPSIRFSVNGEIIKPVSVIKEFCLEHVKEFYPERNGKKVGFGIFGLAPEDYPLGINHCGVLICAYGKVIKTELFNQFPGIYTSRLFGLVEIPELVEFLTTSKTDFIKSKKTHKSFESYYGPLRNDFKAWLKELGLQENEVENSSETVKIERELKKILDDIPELSDFLGFRHPKKILQISSNGSTPATLQEGNNTTSPIGGEGNNGGSDPPVDTGDNPGNAPVPDSDSTQNNATPISRTSKKGPKVMFSSRPDRTDMAWVEANNIVINTSHSSYTKISSNNIARKLYYLFSIASAVQKFINTETGNETPDFTFIDRMMFAWGKK